MLIHGARLPGCLPLAINRERHYAKKVKMSELQQRLEAWLRHEIRRAPGRNLPPLSALSRKAGVSIPTLMQAARVLRSAGEIDFGRGRRPRICGREIAVPEAPPTSLEFLCDLMRGHIASGEWAVGTPVPKIASFTLSHRVSDHTVRTAFRILERERVLHRRGKTRYVGPAPDPQPPVSPVSPRFIVILQNGWFDWQWLFQSDRTEQFTSAFYREAERTGVELLPVIASEKDPHNMRGHIYLAGEHAVCDYIRSHRDRYLGALLCSVDYPQLGLATWVRRLLEFGRPVVWFDHEYRGLPAGLGHPLFTRMSMEETRVSSCAVEALARYGHRHVGYPLDPDVPWQVLRLKLMREEVARQGLNLTFVETPMGSQRMTDSIRTGWVRRLKAISEIPLFSLPAKTRSVIQTFDGSSWLAPLLADFRISAILAPCDTVGRQVYEWLSALRVRLPDRFSLLSFDNYRSHRSLPMTSVDFGFGRLGYCAFHALTRDIPIQRDRRGALMATPFLCHRSSLGPARRTP
jgi:DNA-binding LacI/PurR family transcriptional regulator/DNA-binding transcriptional regulator YhcF (GntR family)